MAAATTAAPAISLGMIPPVSQPAALPSAAAVTTTAPTPAATPNAVQSTQLARTTRKFSELCTDFKRVCSNIEIWVLYMTIVGLAIALLGLPYMLRSTKDSQKSLALAQWTATKDFWEHCSSQNEISAGLLTPECTKALATPLSPPPLRKRGFEFLKYSSLDGGISPGALRAVSTATAFFGLFIVCAGLAARSGVHLSRQRPWQWLWTSRTLEHLSTSSSSAFNETTTHVPVAIPRLSGYSSAVTPRHLVTTQLRYRVKSHHVLSKTPQEENAWEGAGHSMGDDDGHDPHGSDLDNQSVIPGPDSDESDIDTANLPVAPVTSVNLGMHGSKQSQDDSSVRHEGEDLASVSNGPISVANKASGNWLDTREADQAPAEEPEELKYGGAHTSRSDNTISAQDQQGQVILPNGRKEGPSIALPLHYATDASARQRQTFIQRHAEEELTSWFDDEAPEEKKPSGRRNRVQMLSKALAKANTAVLLDNASKIDDAIEAYAEACDLLQQVMLQVFDVDDRKKLAAIRKTYSNRIAEFHDLDDAFAGPVQNDQPDDQPSDDTNGAFFGNVAETSTINALDQMHIPPQGESLLPSIFGGDQHLEDSSIQGLHNRNPEAELAPHGATRVTRP